MWKVNITILECKSEIQNLGVKMSETINITILECKYISYVVT
jgi:hypothetical protein